MPIVAPFVAQAKAKYDMLNAQFSEMKEIAEQQRPTIFVEGTTDQILFSKAWNIFSGCSSEAVNFTCGGEAYGGSQALTSRAIAWLLTIRHRPQNERVRSVGLFDSDLEGKKERAALGKEIDRLKLGQLGFKPLGIRTPVRLVGLARAGFNLSIDLESLYTDDMWRFANENEWLEPVKNLGSVLSAKHVEQLAMGGENPFDRLAQEDILRLKKCFKDEFKKRAARRLSSLSDARARVELEIFILS